MRHPWTLRILTHPNRSGESGSSKSAVYPDLRQNGLKTCNAQKNIIPTLFFIFLLWWFRASYNAPEVVKHVFEHPGVHFDPKSRLRKSTSKSAPWATKISFGLRKYIFWNWHVGSKRLKYNTFILSWPPVKSELTTPNIKKDTMIFRKLFFLAKKKQLRRSI